MQCSLGMGKKNNLLPNCHHSEVPCRSTGRQKQRQGTWCKCTWGSGTTGRTNWWESSHKQRGLLGQKMGTRVCWARQEVRGLSGRGEICLVTGWELHGHVHVLGLGYDDLSLSAHGTEVQGSNIFFVGLKPSWLALRQTLRKEQDEQGNCQPC